MVDFSPPEIVDLRLGELLSQAWHVRQSRKGAKEGIKDTFRHSGSPCAAVSSVFDRICLSGGAVAQWVSYAHATQSAKTVESERVSAKEISGES